MNEDVWECPYCGLELNWKRHEAEILNHECYEIDDLLLLTDEEETRVFFTGEIEE